LDIEDYISKRKSLHISIPSFVHRVFKARMAENGLSMQLFISEVATRCAENDPDIEKIIEDLKEHKRKGTSPIRHIDAGRNEIYDLLERDDDL
jgi:hypothetical protein